MRIEKLTTHRRLPILVLCFMAFLLGNTPLRAAVDAPFPIQPLPQGADWQGNPNPDLPAVIITADQPGDCSARVTFRHDQDALYLYCDVKDDSIQISTSKPTVGGMTWLHQYDSLEIWIGRHHLRFGAMGKDAVAFDCLRESAIADAQVVYTQNTEGYALAARLPWKSLELSSSPRKQIQLGIQINDTDEEDQKTSRSKYVSPSAMVWDRSATYGAAFLNDTVPAGACATQLVPLAIPQVEVGAYVARTRLILRSVAQYQNIPLRYKAFNPKGSVLGDGEVRGSADLIIDLPTGDTAGICRLELTGVLPAGEFGPVTTEYFSPGSKPLREYQSSIEPPADFDAFWDARLAELKETPMEPVVEKVSQSDDNADLLKVTLNGWRNTKFIVYVSIPREKGPFPLTLWVYPASSVALDKIKPRKDQVQLFVHPRGYGESRQFTPAPKSLYVADVSDPLDFYPLANFMDIIRGIDYATTLPAVDTTRIQVAGGSRGAYLTVALAALDSRITLASATVPCYADVDLMGRLGNDSAAHEAFNAYYGGTAERQKRMRHVWQYFDAVNFAHRIRCPIVIEAGMIDTICPAPGIVDAFNRIASKDKVLSINPEHGHTGTENGRTAHRLLEQLSQKAAQKTEEKSE